MPAELVTQHSERSWLGALALIFGTITALVAALAFVSRKKLPSVPKEEDYDGWGESLGI